MSKNVLIITTSLRVNSNSDKLADAFVKGAKEAGNNVEVVSLKGMKIAFCRGCFACAKTGMCVIGDDANLVTEGKYNAEVDGAATPN